MRAIMPGAASDSGTARPLKFWPVRDVEQVGAELVDLGEQAGLAGGGDAEHGDDRGDADRDPERRERGAQPARAHADAGQPREVGGPQPRRREAGGGGGHGASLTSANAAGARAADGGGDDVAARPGVRGERRRDGDAVAVGADRDGVACRPAKLPLAPARGRGEGHARAGDLVAVRVGDGDRERDREARAGAVPTRLAATPAVIVAGVPARL